MEEDADEILAVVNPDKLAAMTIVERICCRLPVWCCAVLIGAWLVGGADIQWSRHISEHHDPSAMAWVGFFPFMIPVWVVRSLFVVAFVAVPYELASAAMSWWQDRRPHSMD